MSSKVPNLPAGTVDGSGRSTLFSRKPGEIMLTVTPWRASLWAKERVRIQTPVFPT